jgi:hypothetical protein
MQNRHFTRLTNGFSKKLDAGDHDGLPQLLSEASVAEGKTPAQVAKRKENTMAKVPPFHSKRESDRKVYHDNDRCTEGNNIETYNRVSGTGGRPRCEHCERLS